MSDAPAAQVTQNGALPTTQDNPDQAPSHKVFAGNLAYSTTDEGLKAFFAPVQADILSAEVIFRGSRPAGYGFVTFSSAEAAQQAVDLLSKKQLDGREILVEVAKSADQKPERRERKTKWRSNRRGVKPVPGEVSEAEASGDPEAVPQAHRTAVEDDAPTRPRKKKSPRKPKQEAGEASGDAAPPADGEVPKKASPRPRRQPRAPRVARPAGQDPAGEPSKSVLFVANLGFNVDDDGLKVLFTDAGISVVSARIVRRHWGTPRKSKGYGFVDVGDEAEQQKAIQILQGKEVEGRVIVVKVAVNTVDNPEGVTEAADQPEAAAQEVA